jgi:glycosyltransferase involved in cell wall biosynthesis
MTKRHVFIIDNSTAITGAFRSILYSLTHIKTHYNITFIQDSKAPVIIDRDIRRCAFSFLEPKRNLSLVLYLPVLFRNSFKILSLIKNQAAPTLHVNDLYNMCGIVVKLFRPEIKLIYHIRLLPTSYAKSLYKVWRFFILKYADEVICVSQSVASHWPEQKNIHVIYDAIGSSEKLPSRMIGFTQIVTFLYLANFIPGKGHDAALHAFNEVYKRNPQVRLRVVGGDMGLTKNREFKDSLLQYATKHKLNAVVSIESFSDNVEALMKQADIFLNFSESESFSMTCLEALYFGTPCIATACGGPSEIIEDGVSGLLVPVGDVSKMKELMIDLASDIEKRKLFSINGRLRARTVFNIETQAAKLATIYSS